MAEVKTAYLVERYDNKYGHSRQAVLISLSEKSAEDWCKSQPDYDPQLYYVEEVPFGQE